MIEYLSFDCGPHQLGLGLDLLQLYDCLGRVAFFEYGKCPPEYEERVAVAFECVLAKVDHRAV